MIHNAWLALVALCVAVQAHAAASPDYPVRPIRLIAAQSAGSSLDTVVRIVIGKMGELLGQQLVIDNRGGAGGTIGVELAARAVPDGYTLLAGASSSMIVARWNKGGGPMAQAVIAGEAAYSISPAAAVVGFIKSGRLRGIAISSKQRAPLLPELPTIDESGVPGYEFSSWNGVFAPRGTPRAIVQKVHQTIDKALADPAVRAGFAAQGLAPSGSPSPQAFAQFFRDDFKRVEKLVQVAGVKPE